MSVRSCCLVVAVGLLGVAQAKTVAWWRFDDLGAEGGKATAETRFLNLTDPGMYPAIPCSFKGYASGTDEAYMPSLVKLAGATPKLTVFDPVSSNSYPVSTVLSCPWGGNGSKLSGGAKVALEPDLYGGREDQDGSLTFECFFRTSAESLSRSASMVGLVCLKSPSNMGAFSLMVYNKRLWTRCDFEDHTGNVSMGGVTDVTPDEWHHAALVYDTATGKLKIYLDYKDQGTSDVANAGKFKPFSQSEPIYLGKGVCINEDRSLAGEMAEARISDVALTPDQFLRFREDDGGDRLADGDKDTYLWYSLDSLAFTNRFLATEKRLVTSYDNDRFATVTSPEGAVPPAVTTDTSTSYIRRSGSLSSPAMTNIASLAVLTNNSPSSYLSLPSSCNRIAGDSFTLEYYFKAAHPVVTGTGNVRCSYGLACASFVKMLINQDGGALLCRFKGTDMDRDISLRSSKDDGEWHHVAVVYDAPKQEGSFYCDGVRVGTLTIPGLKVNEKTPFTIGYANDGVAQAFDGLIDEVRITRRALAPEEFLSCIAESGRTLAWIRFEDERTTAFPYGTSAVLDSYVRDSGKPTFTRGRSAELDLSKGGNERLANTGALKVEGGCAYWPRMIDLEKPNVTIEFFWRPYEKAAPWPCVLGLANLASGPVDVASGITYFNVPWYFSYSGSWGTTYLNFGMSVTNTVLGKTDRTFLQVSPTFHLEDATAPADRYYSRIVSGCDGRWHHVAVTLEEIEGEEGRQTRATAYWDYAQVDTRTVAGTINWSPKGHWLTMVRNGQDRRLATWDIDEIRISDGVLTPDEFLHTSRRGSMILVR